MNKAELIRHEIEKRRDHNLAIGNPLFVAMAEEDIELLLFIDSLQEEPVSEELDEAAKKACQKYFPDENNIWARPNYEAECAELAFKAGAEWQKKQDQSTIELAEDHAMLAGMEKMKEEMMNNAIDATIGLPYENKDGGYTHLIDVSRPLLVGNNKIAIIFKED